MNDPRGTRYPMTMVTRARELREAGWTLDRVRDLIGQEFGQRPAHTTILCWTNAKSLRRQRAAVAADNRRRTQGRRVERMLELAEAGLTFEAVAAVMRLDTGEKCTVHQVRYALHLVDYSRSAETRNCVECGEPFSLSGERGRPPLRCPEHRRRLAAAA